MLTDEALIHQSADITYHDCWCRKPSQEPALREHCLDRLLGVGHRPGCPKQLGSKATQQHRWHTGSTESKSFVSCPYHPLQLLLCFFHKRICLASLASHSILPSLPDDLLESLNIPPAGCAENYAAPNSMERRL